MTQLYACAIRCVKLCRVLSILTLYLLLSTNLFAEGSKELSANGGYRAYMYSTTTATAANPFPTQGTVKVYAKVGERIYVGSSAQGIGNGTIILKAPNGTTYTTGNSTLVGRISSRTQEVNGPNVVSGVGLGYNAGIYTVASGQEGIWEITFVAPNSSSTTSPTAILANGNWSQPSTAYIAAFDVSVYDPALLGGSFKTGRAYMNIFSANMGNYQYGFNGIFYVQTKDGYKYTVDNNGQTGFAFTFFVNNKGHRKTDGTPSYLSVDDLSTINVKDPRTADSETDITHKLFFNPVNADVPASSTSAAFGTEWLQPAIPTLSVGTVTFTGVEGSPGVAGTNPSGGNFSFTSNVAGNYSLVIDINQNNSFTDAVDRTLIGVAVAGSNSIYWDGKDGTGAKVAATPASGTLYRTNIVLFGGEVHFPYIDVENNVNGILITRTNGPATNRDLVNWDDTPINAAGTTPPNPLKTTYPGISSNTNGHKYGSTSYSSTNFGNDVLLDTWSYVLSDPATSSTTIVIREADLETVSLTVPPAATTLCVGQTTSYTVVVRNNGPYNVTGASFRLLYPAQLTNVSVTSAVSGTATVSNGTVAATQYTASLNMNNAATVTFTVTGTVSGVPTGGNMLLTASIMRPNDVTDPDATNPDPAPPTDPQNECDSDPSGVGCNNIKTSSQVVYAVPTTSVAGPAQTLCAATSTTLAGNTPTVGTGTWTKVSGPGTQVITTPTAASTTVTGLTTGTYVFRWTITNGSCASSSSDVTITVQPALSGNTITAPSTVIFCGSGDPSLINGATPTGGSGTYTYQWQSSTDNTNFTDISGATAANYDPPVVSTTTYYRRMVTSGACTTASASNVVTITVQASIANNTITAPSTTVFCETGDADVINGTTPTGGSGTYTYQWQSSTDNTNWTNLSGSTAAAYDPVRVATTVYYRRLVTSSACTGASTSNVVTITVNPAATAGVIAASQTFCVNGDPAAFTQTTAPTGGNGTYTYQWQSSTTSSSSGFTDISGATSVTYDAPVISQNTWYRRIVRSTGCSDAISNVLAITIHPQLTPGSIGAAQTFCGSGDPAVLTEQTAPAGGNGTFAYQWQSSTTSATTGFTDISGATSSSYDPASISQTTYYRRIVRSDFCSDAITNVVTVTVQPSIANNTITGVQTVCAGGVPAGLNGTTPTGGNGAYTYLWESSTTGGSGFAPAPGNNSIASYNPPALTQTTIYRRTVTSGACGGSVSNIIQVTVTATAPVANAGPDQGPLNATVATLAGNNSGSGAGTWTQVSGPNTASIVNTTQPNTSVTNLVPGTYVFRWTISNAPCPPTTDDVNIIVNAPPVANNDNVTTNEDVAVTINILSNDSDADGSIASVQITSQPANGTLVLNANNTVTYTPRANYNGQDVFTYTVRDNLGTTSNTATVTINITPVNDAPVAQNDNINVAEDTPLSLPAPGILDNDYDVDGGTLVASVVSTTTHGTLVLNADGSLQYTPNQDYTGPDQFTYRVCDASGLCATATVTINVGNVNDAPVAVNNTYNVAEDVVLNVSAAAGVLSNDTDADGDPLTANLVSGTTHGTLTLNPDGSFRYTPNQDYNGSDAFTYSACDASGACSNATVTINVTPVNDKPFAGDDAYNTSEDIVLNVPAASGVLFNDSDVDGNPLSVSLITGPAAGTLVLNANGSFTYTPAANYNGAVTFTYRVCDNSTPQLCDTGAVVITVNPVNDAPVAGDDSYTTAEDVPLSISAPGVLGNDTDIDSDVLTASIITNPAHGTLTLDANGHFTYTPAANYNGPDAFTYRVCDNAGGCDTATVSITVTPVNDRPVALDASFNLTEDQPLTVAAPGLLLNDRDVDGDQLSASLLTAPTHGTVVVNANGSFTYTPNANYNGTDRFTYLSCDNGSPSLCDTAEIVLNIAPANDSPQANDDAYTLNEDTPLTITPPGLLANDTDLDGDALTASVVTQPAHGTLTINPDGSFTYRPDADYNGSDAFSYRACDGNGACDTATVNFTVTAVNDAPVAADDNYTTTEDVTLTVNIPGVLFNDRDLDGDAISASIVTQPASGNVVMNANGSFTFTPAANFNGTVTFTYRVCDPGGLCDTATVTIGVDAANDLPVAGNDNYTLNEDTPLTIAAPGVLGNDTDADGDALTAGIITQPAHGTVTLNANGGFVYTPAANYNGTDTFTYRVCDPFGGCDTAIVAFSITAVNDAPAPAADTYTLTEDQPLTIAAPGLLFNDIDVDGDPLTASLVTGAAHGTVVVNADGSFTYTPVSNYNGIDSFRYNACDASGACTPVTVTLTVNAAQDRPVAADDNITAVEDTPLSIGSAILLLNDVDVDGDPLTVSLYSQPQHGTIAIAPDGSFIYTPNPDYNGPDYFVYQVCDNAMPAGCDTATVFITVTAVNDAPVPADDNYSIEEDRTLTVPAPGLLLNDREPDGETLTAALQTQAAHGTVTINSNGSFTYVPAADFNGIDSFTYRACDASGNCTNAIARVVVTPANDAPVSGNDALTLDEDIPLTFTNAQLISNDNDPDGDPLQLTITVQPQHGRLINNNDGSYTYVPDSNYNGPDSFIYQVCDPVGACATATVNIIVNAVNDPVIARDDEFKTAEDTPISILFSQVLANDEDPENETLTVTILGQPANGSIVVNANGFTYTPLTNSDDLDSVRYQVCEPGGVCDTATIYFRIDANNDVPVAADNFYTVNEDTRLVIAAPGVLAGDTDADDAILTASLAIAPTNGTLTLRADGSFEYIPNNNFNGNDQFTYFACDGSGACDSATVFITVTPVNDRPIAGADAFTTNEDVVLTNVNLLTNDSDPDGDALNISLVANPQHGTAVIAPDGTLTYTPSQDYNGTDFFSYQVCDGGGLCDTTSVTITVNAVNDAPVVNDDQYDLDEDTPLVVPAPGVLANDIDADGELIVSILQAPSKGALTLALDGSFTYTPLRDFNGLDTFTYQACDVSGACTQGTVILRVRAVNDAPVAVNDTITLNEEQVVVLNPAVPQFILLNDYDVDGDQLTATPIGVLGNGSLVANPDGTYTYTPNKDFSGVDHIAYRLCDNGTPQLCDTGYVTIYLNNVNDAPVAVADSFAVNEDEILIVPVENGVLRNDTDADNEPLVATVVTTTNGRLSLNNDGSFQYRPNLNFNGVDSFTYRACDIAGACDTAVVHIFVAPVNDAPVGVDDYFERREDTVITFPASVALINDFDPDGDVLTGRPIGSLTKGTFTDNGNGTYTYRPAKDFNGLDSIEYQVCDPYGLCDTAIIRLLITPVNDPPVASPTTYATAEDVPLVLTAPGILANDSDVDGDNIVASLLQPTRNGTVTLNSDGSMRYTPNANFNGLDSLLYTVCDISGACDTGVIYINVTAVNDPPVANGDSYTTNEDVVLTVPAPGVLANDTDPDGNTLTVNVLTPPNNGTLTLNADGSFNYTPNPNFNGQDMFTYEASDGEFRSSNTVYINVTPVADPPVAVSDTFNLQEDIPLNVPTGVLANDINIDNEPLNVTVVTQPTKGTLTLNGSGGVTYIPTLNANGLDSAVYRICTPISLCSEAKIYFNVAPVNDPPVGVDDYFERREDTVITFPASVALINDYDPDGDVLTGRPIGSLTKGTFTDNGNGTYTYRPARDFNGLDSIEYQVCDPYGLCDTAIIRLLITPVNDAPVAVDDAYTTNEDITLSVPAPAILANDTDVDGDMLNVAILARPAHGRLTLNPDHSFSYQPDRDFNGTDAFTYIVNDPSGLSDTGQVVITVTPVNDPPAANSAIYSTQEDTQLTLPAPGILANATDPDGDPLTASLSVSTRNGLLVLNADGSLQYTPNANFNGLDSLVYVVCDPSGSCDTAQVYISVNAVNDAPAANADEYATNEDVVLTVPAPGVLDNDTDPDGNTLTVNLVTPPANGTLTLNPNGSFTYTPNANFNGQDVFTYAACDAEFCDTNTVRITVQPVADAPVAVNDTLNLQEDQVLTLPGAVLANDINIDNELLTVTVAIQPTKGTLTLNNAGDLVYRPNQDANGLDSATYRICTLGGQCSEAKIYFNIAAVNDTPVANSAVYSTPRDIPLVLPAPGILANGTDVDGDALTASLVTGPVNGSATLNADGSLRYTPNNNFTGRDSLVYRVCDATGTCDTSVIYINVTAGANRAPVANEDGYTTNEDQQLNIPAPGLLGNDTDPDGDVLAASLITQAQNGTVTVNVNGSFTYTPYPNFNGTDAFTYSSCDGAFCDTNIVRIIVQPVDDELTAVNDILTVAEDGVLNQLNAILGNDINGEGTPLTVTVLTQPAKGTLTLNNAGDVIYRPNPDANGQDSVTYRICTPSGQCSEAKIYFNITAVNDAPVASSGVYTTQRDVPLVVPAPGVLDNATDLDGDALTASLVTNGQHGTAVLNANGSLTYTPNSNFVGRDSLVYRVCDPSGVCDTSVIYINITGSNRAPVANVDTYTTNEDVVLTVSVPGLLANDTDPDGDRMTVNLITQAASGRVVLSPDGSFTYTPNRDFNGQDVFTYSACDGEFCDTNTVRITVQPVADQLIAVNDTLNVQEDGVLNQLAAILGNDINTDNDPLTVTIITQPTKGTLTLNNAGDVIYRPSPDANGIDSATYRICTPANECASAKIYFNIAPVNDTPVAGSGVYATPRDVTLILPAPGILDNASDVDGGTLTVSVVAPVRNGTALLYPDGSFTYTPNNNYTGLDSLVYAVCDGQGACDTSVIYINVTGSNRPPVANADAYTTDEDAPLTINAPGLLANDTDPDGNVLAAGIIAQPANGQVTINANGSFMYTPNPDYNGQDVFTYAACDGQFCDTSTVTITVRPVADALTAVNDSFNLQEDGILNQLNAILGNDINTDNDPLTVTVITAPRKGTLTVSNAGDIIYRPNPNANGLDSAVYRICSPDNICSQAKIYFNIAPVNDLPVVSSAVYATRRDVPLVVNAPGLLVYGSDPDGDALSASLVAQAKNGTVVIGSDGSLQYTPLGGFAGLDSLVFALCDVNGGCDTNLVYINVAATNRAPVANVNDYTTNEDVPLAITAPGILANDVDADGDALRASLIAQPANGTVTLNANGSFTYTPKPNFNGQDIFTYSACDGEFCDTAIVRINVQPVDDGATAVNDSLSVQEDGVLNFTGVLTNDLNPDNKSLTVTLVTSPAKGTLTLSSTGVVTYRPNPDANGLDSAIYRICSPDNLCSEAKIYFDILPVNDKPVAVDDAYATNMNVALSVPPLGLLANDTDVDGDVLTVAVLTPPAHGRLTLNADKSFSYAPNAGYTGTDVFTYVITDPGGLKDTAQVTITIRSTNGAPNAADDIITLNENTVATGTLIANDSDPDGDVLAASIVTTAVHGTFVLNANGTYTYTPNANYDGVDSITYKVCDPAGLCDTAKVRITINNVPGQEVALAGLAKAANPAQLQADGSYLMSFVFTVRNTGTVNLKNVMVTDNLSPVFPSPVTFTVQSVAASGTLVANTSFNGTTNTALLQNLSTLDVGKQDSITLTLRVNTNGSFGPFSNTATLAAQSVTNNAPVSDASNSGRDPVANGNTPTSFSFTPRRVIGVAKMASDPVKETDGSYTITYTFYVKNMGNVALQQVRLTDDLSAVFPTPMTFSVIRSTNATGALSANTNFNGSTNTALLNATNSTLAVNRQDTVSFTVNVQPNRQSGTYNNVATAIARPAGFTLDISDISTNGNLVDPDANGTPDEQSATPVVFGVTKLFIPGGFSPNGDGKNDRFVITNAGSDRISLEVYNRWGNAVYKSTDYKNDWNGKCNTGFRFGDDLPDGTYYYIVVNITTGERYMSYITIMR